LDNNPEDEARRLLLVVVVLLLYSSKVTSHATLNAMTQDTNTVKVTMRQRNRTLILIPVPPLNIPDDGGGGGDSRGLDIPPIVRTDAAVAISWSSPKEEASFLRRPSLFIV
jgi:hypothetical protein